MARVITLEKRARLAFGVLGAIWTGFGCSSSASVDSSDSLRANIALCTLPLAHSVSVSPNRQTVGHAVQVSAVADSGVSYQWSSSGIGAGYFADSAAATTKFTCTGSGMVTLALLVFRDGCATHKAYSLECIAGQGASSGGAPGLGGGLGQGGAFGEGGRG